MRNESALTEFISCYFNQDWGDLTGDPWENVRLYAYREGPVEEVEEAAKEARELIARRLASEDLNSLLDEDYGLEYRPSRAGYETNDWLSRVADILEEAVQLRRTTG